jgi:hypothetical protein
MHLTLSAEVIKTKLRYNVMKREEDNEEASMKLDRKYGDIILQVTGEHMKTR